MGQERLKAGRPRSEQAREAVLHAVDDLVVEIGYGAVTLKGIAERAGVSRQTVYRWWSTKAEILLEASVIDAQKELSTAARDDATEDLGDYLDALVRFLTTSPAGTAYRALLGEAQHDAAVGELLAANDVLGDSAAVVIERAVPSETMRVPMPTASALLVGPVFFSIASGRAPEALDTRAVLAAFIRGATTLDPAAVRKGNSAESGDVDPGAGGPARQDIHRSSR